MADFKIALKKTLEHEGGYSDLAGDTGGETIFGISKNNHPKSILWKELNNYKQGLSPFDKSKYKEISALARNNRIISDEVARIYKTSYWDRIKGDSIKNQDMANNIFDMAVNAGVNRAIFLLQSALGVVEDGIIGEKTLNALNNTLNFKDLNNEYVEKRNNFYNTRKNKTYLKSWLNRAKSYYL